MEYESQRDVKVRYDRNLDDKVREIQRQKL